MRSAVTLAVVVAMSWVGVWTAACRADSPSSLPVLLVHGLVWQVDGDDVTWGCRTNDGHGGVAMDGMIRFLDKRGLAYGGAIRPNRGRLVLPENLDTRGASVEPQDARLFVLKFSPSANTDGLALKALELAEAVRQVCRLTGAPKVRIVAHSAGGLVARAYLQDALPGVHYRHDVDRLVTIATPHLGAAVASWFGDFLGTRATSIKPEASLVRQLDSELDLPAGTTFASIVVRGIAADARGEGERYDPLVERAILDRLPVEYRVGGDQVVQVRSQNLRLARCATRYEQRTGKPVQYVLARVPDPSPDDRWPTETKVHMVAPRDPMVEHLVYGLVKDDALLWSRARPEQLAGWIDWQARLYANGAIEAATLGEHPMSEVRNVRLDDFELMGGAGGRRRYAFDGEAFSRNMLISLRRRWTHVHGELGLEFDCFGRVLSAETSVQ